MKLRLENPLTRKPTCGGCRFGLADKNLGGTDELTDSKTSRHYILDGRTILVCAQRCEKGDRNPDVRANQRCVFDPPRYEPLQEARVDRVFRLVVGVAKVVDSAFEKMTPYDL